MAICPDKSAGSAWEMAAPVKNGVDGATNSSSPGSSFNARAITATGIC